jgi:hypothetical protein
MAGRKTKTTPAIEAYVKQRRTAGLSHKAIQGELVQMGTPLSVGAVHKIAPGKTATAVTSDARVVLNHQAKLEPDTDAIDGAQVDAVLALLDDDADLATIEESLASGQRMARAAEEVKNLAGWAVAQRIIAKAVELRRKFRPPPVEKPEDNPDFVAAGQRAAERLHRLVDEALRAVNETRREVA